MNVPDGRYCRNSPSALNYIVKPVLRGHLWNKDKVVIYKTGDPLKEVQFK